MISKLIMILVVVVSFIIRSLYSIVRLPFLVFLLIIYLFEPNAFKEKEIMHDHEI